MTLRISTPSEEGIYQGSKWLKFQVLCDREELEKLFSIPFEIYPLTGVISLSQVPMAKSFFLDEYASWIEALKQGRIPTDAELRRTLACAFSPDPNALWLQKVGEERYLMKIAQPVVQVQAHYFAYSPLDGVFRPMSMGAESIFWGLQFSFPQIYQNPKTMELSEVGQSSFFQNIREWVRETTRATPFTVEGKKTNVPIRLGKNCFTWIHSHPQLAARGIHVS